MAQLKLNLTRAQAYMKLQADKKRTHLEFNIGDMVLVKLQPYRQLSILQKTNNKLGMRYFGPFKVLQKVGYVAYKLQLPESAKIHPVFHVSLLKPFKGDHSNPYVPLSLITSEDGSVLQPIAILHSRVILRGGEHISQVFVKWGGLKDYEAT